MTPLKIKNKWQHPLYTPLRGAGVFLIIAIFLLPILVVWTESLNLTPISTPDIDDSSILKTVLDIFFLVSMLLGFLYNMFTMFGDFIGSFVTGIVSHYTGEADLYYQFVFSLAASFFGPLMVLIMPFIGGLSLKKEVQNSQFVVARVVTAVHMVFCFILAAGFDNLGAQGGIAATAIFGFSAILSIITCLVYRLLIRQKRVA